MNPKTSISRVFISLESTKKIGESEDQCSLRQCVNLDYILKNKLKINLQ